MENPIVNKFGIYNYKTNPMIKSSKWSYKLPFKLTLIFSVFGLVALIFIYLTLTENFQENSYTEFYNKKDIIARQLAANARYELLLNNKKNQFRTLADSSILKELKYLVLTNDTGKVLFSYNLPVADTNKYNSISKPSSLPINTTYSAFIDPLKNYKLLRDYIPVLRNDSLLGKMYFGVPIESLGKKIYSQNMTYCCRRNNHYFLLTYLLYSLL